MFEKENTQAGCQQCHAKDRVTQGAETLNLGRDLFAQRGCMGCHRYEGFDAETDALNSTRQTLGQLEDQITANEKQMRDDTERSGQVEDNAEAQRLLAHADSLRVANSLLAARIDQLNLQARYLMQDQKKVGPNLKDVRLKLRKEWIPVWLKDPQAFRPGTKMPAFRLEDDDIESISAYLWQSAVDGPKLATQSQGDAAHGKDLFKSLGCLGCHSIDGQRIDQGSGRVGGTFAADLSRLGEKANYDYIVRWVHNPRERSAPYCPTEKRDLTPEDYAMKGLPFVFDA